METIENATVLENSDEYCRVIVFVDDPENPKHFFMVQRSRQFDEQDEKLGLDSIHLQVDDQSRSCYGGLRMVAFNSDSVDIYVSDEAASKLKTSEKIRIFLKADAANSAVLDALKEMLIEDGVQLSDSSD